MSRKEGVTTGRSVSPLRSSLLSSASSPRSFLSAVFLRSLLTGRPFPFLPLLPIPPPSFVIHSGRGVCGFDCSVASSVSLHRSYTLDWGCVGPHSNVRNRTTERTSCGGDTLWTRGARRIRPGFCPVRRCGRSVLPVSDTLCTRGACDAVGSEIKCVSVQSVSDRFRSECFRSPPSVASVNALCSSRTGFTLSEVTGQKRRRPRVALRAVVFGRIHSILG